MAYTITVQKRAGSHPKPASAAEAQTSSSSAFPLTLEFAHPPTVAELKRTIRTRSPRLAPERQRLTTVGETQQPLLDDKASVDQYVAAGGAVSVKDLGPQVAWRTVFLTEYFGPLWIHPLIYASAPLLWRRPAWEPSQMQILAHVLVLAHYAKREWETVFVHRFSADTMPLFNLFKNSAHYWGLSGVLLALGVYGPGKGADALAGGIRQDGSWWIYTWAGAMLLAEVANLKCHVMLSNLRPPGTRVRKVPRGFAFEWVSCPNYFFETLSWVCFSLLTLSPAALLFTAVSAGQMLIWAQKKHRNYRKEFPDYPQGRKAMLPFLL